MKDAIIVEDAEELDAVRPLRYKLFKEWFRLLFVCCQHRDDERKHRFAELCGVFVNEWLQ